MKLLPVLLLAVAASGQTLHYVINWPSGLSLGEATLTASRSQAQGSDPGATSGQWSFGLDLDASVPGFDIRDHYHSTASADLCSVQLDKKFAHGKRKAEEQITFDQARNVIARGNPGSDKTESSVGPCARDALAFVQFVRNELAQGRLAPQQQVVFGALYQVRLEYGGAQPVKVGDKSIDSDRISATIKGPASDTSVEIFFSRDNVRTPVLARMPVPLGMVSVELVR